MSSMELLACAKGVHNMQRHQCTDCGFTQGQREAKKLDIGKPQLSLNPPEALAAMAQAFEYGARKYARNNYKKGMAWTRLIDAALRHITAFAHGEDIDSESGNGHIAHALACLAMLEYCRIHHNTKDDRNPPETT